MKQKAIFIGNCQCSGILELLKFTSFYEKYDVKQYANWQMIKNKDAAPIKDIQTADLILYQPLRDEYGCYSTKRDNSNSMFHEVRDSTDLISFPRIHNNSLWPLYHITNSKESFYGTDFFKYYYDQQIKTNSEFMYLYDNMLLDFKFGERFNKNIEISISKEEATDIKIVNFLQANIKKYRLFLTQDHPTTRVFEHCTKYIINKLDLSVKDYYIDDLDENLTKLEDSTYGFSTMKYPDSKYSLRHFNYEWNNYNIDELFYRINLEHFLKKTVLFKYHSQRISIMYSEFDSFKKFRQIIVWGFPLHTHTHSYIHGAWVKTFKHLGFQVYWFHDKEYPQDFDYSNTCFITEGWADDNIPVNSSSTYFVHIAKNPAKYLDLGARLIEIRYNVLEIHDFNYDYKLPENPVYLSRDTLYERLSDDSAVASRRSRPVNSTPYEAIYMYWATDLLPHEFNYSDAENIVNTNTIHYIGSIGENHPFTQFKHIGSHLGFNVVHHDPWTHPISYEENIKLMKESYCVPDFRSQGDASKHEEYGRMNGTNHLDIGYMPCRVLKAISYGRTGITNSKRVKDILGEFVEYAEMPAEVFEINERRKGHKDWRKDCMKYIAENHTFLQRARDLARALQMKSYETTIVTAMYDIGREKIDGRSINTYKAWLYKTLETLIDPIVVYLDSSLKWKSDILKIRGSVGCIEIIETKLCDIPMWKYRQDVERIQRLESFKTIQKYKNDITNLLPEYTLIQYSKFGWLEDTQNRNTFNSSQYIWIDGGFSRFYDTNSQYKCTRTSYNSFSIQADHTITRIPSLFYDNYIGSNECIFHGWLWVVSAKRITDVKEEVIRIWEKEMLEKNRLDNEQIAIGLAFKNRSELFNVIYSRNGDPPSIFIDFFTKV